MELICFEARHSLPYYLDRLDFSYIKKAFDHFSNCFGDNFHWEATDGLQESSRPEGLLRYEIQVFVYASTLYDLSQVEQAFHTMCRLNNFPYFQLQVHQG